MELRLAMQAVSTKHLYSYCRIAQRTFVYRSKSTLTDVKCIAEILSCLLQLHQGELRAYCSIGTRIRQLLLYTHAPCLFNCIISLSLHFTVL
ncbi:Os10g0548350 [Oryza sativa Japonica Group]|uniref:Os10g0548350 protein n=1 Tax=Oryza sativa subsp. japonica TaxID=39947 RepID=A0A0P0XWV0_ORYSJ|nr:hypothetical protein EE612_052618 [Oryza sativa]BAT11926.1 Os10g0548350 [Oryza sativa Japonica Group]